MADPRPVEPVVRVCAVITRYPAAFDWAQDRLASLWGERLAESEPLEFEASGYYTASMGPGLSKTLVAFTDCIDPAGLADWKLQTNRWETEYAERFQHPHERPLNLDPGYVSQAKLVLATTKDRDHRVYLRDGIFAEVTLTYVGKRWNDHRWTYPSYRTEDVARFANVCRQHLRAHLQRQDQFRRA